jgi:hypothetical protein
VVVLVVTSNAKKDPSLTGVCSGKLLCGDVSADAPILEVVLVLEADTEAVVIAVESCGCFAAV